MMTTILIIIMILDTYDIQFNNYINKNINSNIDSTNYFNNNYKKVVGSNITVIHSLLAAPLRNGF